jgi:hypothetical protein
MVPQFSRDAYVATPGRRAAQSGRYAAGFGQPSGRAADSRRDGFREGQAMPLQHAFGMEGRLSVGMVAGPSPPLGPLRASGSPKKR